LDRRVFRGPYERDGPPRLAPVPWYRMLGLMVSSRTPCIKLPARSRAAAAPMPLDTSAVVPSFGIGPVNLRWIVIHMIDETARHAGHIDLLRDAILA
jgi:Protein of unknown function (DUF664)